MVLALSSLGQVEYLTIRIRAQNSIGDRKRASILIVERLRASILIVLVEISEEETKEQLIF